MGVKFTMVPFYSYTKKRLTEVYKLSKKKRQFSIYKTCFDILMSSSVANELFNGCTFEFMLRYVAKLRVYNLNMKCEMRRKQK